MATVAVFGALAVGFALGQLRGLIVNLVIAFFVGLALEPIVVWLVRHGWRRGVAAFVSLIGSLVVVIVVMALFGNLFVQQLVQLVNSLPGLYLELREYVQAQFDFTLPESDDLLRQAVDQFGADVATGTLMVGSTIIGAVFAALTIMLVTYYLLAAGPQFRSVVCSWFTPSRQTEVLRMWEITQVKVSDFINSRIVLAALSAAFTFVFLVIIDTPYALPLSVFTGVVSQFVPTIGTYLAGALPVAVALTSQGLAYGIAVLVFIIAYQQLENLVFSPKVSARALEMNPAVSFVAVLAFGAVFGPLGAFLALPIAATIQAIGNTYLHRYELVESDLLHDPERSSGSGSGPGDPEGPGDADMADAATKGGSRRRQANKRAAQAAARTVDERREQGIE